MKYFVDQMSYIWRNGVGKQRLRFEGLKGECEQVWLYYPPSAYKDLVLCEITENAFLNAMHRFEVEHIAGSLQGEEDGDG